MIKDKLKLFIENKYVVDFILLVIILNSIILGLMTYPDLYSRFGNLLHISNFVCVLIFTVEMFIKLYVYGKSFFKDGWNNFDFILVAISWVPTGGVFSSFRAFRVLRALRALRLVTRLNKLKIIVQAIIESVPNVSWACVLLLLIYYIFAIMGTTMYSEVSPEYFSSIGNSMYTLFQIMALDDFSTEIARPIMEQFRFSWIYFISFILVSSFIVMNVIVGVIVNAIDEISEQAKLSKLRKKLRKASSIEKELHKLKRQIKIIEQLLEAEREDGEIENN